MPINLKFLCLFLLIQCFVHQWISAGNEKDKLFTISGFVKDSRTGEALIGALVYPLENPSAGISTNAYGYYSLSMVSGNYQMVFQYIGYKKQMIAVDLTVDHVLTVELSGEATLLKEIEVSGERDNKNVMSNEVIKKLNIKEIQSIPVFFGEKDILKTIQLLPGIKSAGEGNSGFYVRGGGADQNLILLDEAPIYNASHLLGFFSVFNSDAIKDVSVYSSGFPAEYGGRLSSVIDVKMNEGNDKEYHVSGGIGLIASRLSVEGPIIKNRGSFMVSARRTYADLFLKLSKDSTLNRNTLYFYDINMKGNYRFGEKDRVYLSFYLGKDVLGFNKAFGIDWGNTTVTARWNHIITNRIFSNTSVIYSKYGYNTRITAGVRNFRVLSDIRDLNLKEDVNYYLNSNNNIKFGVNCIYHQFVPGKVDADSLFHIQTLDKKYAIESAAYISNDQSFSKHFKATYGLRLSMFSSIGPATVFKYDAVADATDSTVYARGKIYSTYAGFEPRIMLNYVINDSSSVKASYTRTRQYLHLLSNSTSSTPMDLWVPSSVNIRPEIADQFSVGYFRNFRDNMFETSVEVYYKFMKDQIDYKNGANLVLNKRVETQLVFGNGRSYGLELLIRKKTGRLTGWIGYTLARSERHFADINNGNTYLAKQDRPNEISIVAIYKLNKKLTVSGTWVFYNGNAVTFPNGRYVVDGNVVAYYTNRNGYRMPNYHRLDLGLTWENKKTAKYESNWNFSVYNAYARENAYAINFQQDPNDPSKMQAVQYSLFRFIPSLTYNFKF
ncbi:MAG: TonB-dependent receptor [Bacteroidetes bacterium]|nr:TonB-dependent receptor [Bacteroidota bacterium]